MHKNQLLSYTSNIKAEFEMKNIIPFTSVPKEENRSPQDGGKYLQTMYLIKTKTK